MLKNVIIGILIVLVLTLVSVCYLKASEATKALEQVMIQQDLTEKVVRMAEEQASKAEAARKEAERIMEKLRACQSE